MASLASWLLNVRPSGLAAREAVLAGGVVVASAFVGVCGAIWMPTSWPSVGVVGLVCWAGAAVALGLAPDPAQPNQALGKLVLGMLARMTPPLGLGLLAILGGRGLDKTPVIYYLLALYPMTLALETWLSLPSDASTRRPRQTN
jgi:hypothetical protein